MRHIAYNIQHAPSSTRPGRTRADNGTPELPAAELAQRLAVLAHPIRVGILRHLLGQAACVSDFVEALGEDQPKISQHLKVLRDGGVLLCRADGRRRCYAVRQPELVRRVLDALAAFDPEAVPAGQEDCAGDPAKE